MQIAPACSPDGLRAPAIARSAVGDNFQPLVTQMTELLTTRAENIIAWGIILGPGRPTPDDACNRDILSFARRYELAFQALELALESSAEI